MIERVLIIGFGSIGQRHLRILKKECPYLEVAVMSRSMPSTDNSITFLSSLESSIAFKPQAAIIASPAPFHLQSASSLAEIGCHLLVEKPLADVSAGVNKLFQVVSNSKVVLQVGYNLRFLPSLVEFRHQVKNHRIGRVLSVRCEVGQNLETWRLGSDYRGSVSAKKELGGGVLLELSHEIDYLRWIFGDVNWVSAWQGRQSDLDIDVEDSAHLLLGMQTQTELDSHEFLIASLFLDFIRHDTTRRCTAIGEYGTLVWDAIDGTVKLSEKNKNQQELLFKEKPNADYTYLKQWHSFNDCITQDRIPVVSGLDALATLHVIEAARQSDLLNGQRVNINNQLA